MPGVAGFMVVGGNAPLPAIAPGAVPGAAGGGVITAGAGGACIPGVAGSLGSLPQAQAIAGSALTKAIRSQFFSSSRMRASSQTRAARHRAPITHPDDCNL